MAHNYFPTVKTCTGFPLIVHHALHDFDQITPKTDTVSGSHEDLKTVPYRYLKDVSAHIRCELKWNKTSARYLLDYIYDKTKFQL